MKKIKAAAHLIMLFNVFLASILILPSCKLVEFDKPTASVTWKVEKVNGLDTVVYQCQLVRSGSQSLITTLQVCDTKSECNQYCDRVRPNYEKSGT